MTAFVLPTPVGGSATGWQLADFLDATFTSPPAAGGVATLELPQLDPGVLWQLSHMVTSCTSVTVTQLRLYLDTVSTANLRDGTASGNFDVADWPGHLIVPQSRRLVAQWTGATDGAIGTLTVQGQVLRQAAG